MEPKPTRCWLRPVSSAARVGEHTAVTWKRLYVMPMSCTRENAGVCTGPPKLSMEPKPASSMRTRRTLGASSGRLGPGDERPVGDRVLERPAGRAAEGLVRDRQHRAVRHELAGRLGERVLETAEAVLVHGRDGLGRRAGEGTLGLEPVLLVDDRDDGGRAGLELLAQTLPRARCRPCAWRTCRRCRRRPRRRRSRPAAAARPGRRGRPRRRPSPCPCGRGGRRSARRGPRRSRRARRG